LRASPRRRRRCEARRDDGAGESLDATMMPGCGYFRQFFLIARATREQTPAA
jgi:hypothetical protein